MVNGDLGQVHHRISKHRIYGTAMLIDQLRDGFASCIDCWCWQGLGSFKSPTSAKASVNTMIEVETRMRTTLTRDVPIRADTCPAWMGDCNWAKRLAGNALFEPHLLQLDVTMKLLRFLT
jgi:hypothetical protein